MARGKKPDPSRKKSCVPHSNYLKVDNGKKVGAYIAGELYGCETHRTFATQPCVAHITDEALPCLMCAGGLISEWRGYVPLWDSDWTLHHVLINRDYFETVDVIPHRAKVSVSRAKNPISPLVIRDEPMLVRELPNRAPWVEKVDMLAVCLTLWKNPDLTRWFEKCGAPQAEDLAAREGIAVTDKGKPFTPMMQAAAKRAGATVIAPLDAQYDAIKNRLQKKADTLKPSTNGNGKHE